MKILLVEDDPLHAAFLRDAVGQALPEVSQILTAENGREGEAMARRDVQAVVMDLQMKERNGIDAARTIWSERPETRILFWSNYADEAYLRGLTRIVPNGSPYGYVLKTAPVQRLHLAMRAVLVEGQVVVDREIHRLQQRQSRPARALCVTLAASLTVLLCTALGLPVSTTHITVGGVFGVGVYREWRDRQKARKRAPMPGPEQERRELVRWSYVQRILGAWVITVPVNAAVAALLVLMIGA